MGGQSRRGGWKQNRRRTRRAVVGQERRTAGSLFLQSGAGRANGARGGGRRADADGWVNATGTLAAGANAHARSRHEPKPASASPPARPLPQPHYYIGHAPCPIHGHTHVRIYILTCKQPPLQNDSPLPPRPCQLSSAVRLATTGGRASASASGSSLCHCMVARRSQQQ